MAWSPAPADLRAALDELGAVDHHAHLLSRPEREWALTDLLSESADPGQRDQVRHHPSHHRARRDLAVLFGVDPDEGALERVRHEAGAEAHSRQLLGACRFEAMLVDDGFVVADAVDLPTQSRLAGCPVHRVVRIEAVAEAAADGWPAFGIVRSRFRDALSDALDRGAVALKTIAAYRGGLDLPSADAGEAEWAYGTWRRTASGDAGPERRRLQAPALLAFFLAEALDCVRRRPVPLQVHTGLGDADLALHRADPSLLGPLVADAASVRVPVVLLHCYPFVRQAAWLASVHPHVFVDLSLTLLLAGHRGADLVLEALDLAPATKLLFATDASRAAEMFFLGARWWRDALAAALGELVAGGSVDEATALEWAGRILAGNSLRLYELA